MIQSSSIFIVKVLERFYSPWSLLMYIYRQYIRRHLKRPEEVYTVHKLRHHKMPNRSYMVLQAKNMWSRTPKTEVSIDCK